MNTGILDIVGLFVLFVILAVLFIIFCIKRNIKAKNLKKHKKKLYDLYKKIEKMKQYFTETESKQLYKLKMSPDIRSYTIDKHDMRLCLENDDGEYYDDNMLIYATLHELAHIFCDEIGHTDKYGRIFNRLLNIEEKVGVYNKSIKLPKEYCGISIT